METLQGKTIVQELGPMVLSDRLGRTEPRTCEHHGPYTAQWIEIGGGFWMGCAACAAEETRRKEDEARQEAAAERQDRAMRNALQRAAIPPRFQDRRFDNFESHCDGAAHALAIMQDYATNFLDALANGRSMLLVGTVGAGKTHLACAAAHSVIEQGHSAVFSSVMGAVRSVKETYSRDSRRTERDAIDALIAPDLLILDEVGVQFGSDAERLILFEIINGRYENVRPTILLSNLDSIGLAQFIGERSMDRLREGGGKMIVFDWPSYRRAA